MVASQSVLDLQRSLRARLSQARSRTDELFAIVKQEALYDRPIAERHRIVFYIGHLEAFDWNLLRERVLAAQAFNPALDRLFAFGIDPVDGGLPADQPSDWPSLAEVQAYVRRVRETLDQQLQLVSLHEPGADGFSAAVLLNVAIEHRLMHAETLAYMLHQLPLDRKIPPPGAPTAVFPPARAEMVEVPAGMATLGLPRGGAEFGWDNEFEQHTVQVPAFAVDKYKVSNQQFLEFMQAGGYQERSLWTDPGWAWRSAREISHPVFWLRNGEGWFYRTMFAEIPLPLSWPVYVSHAEACAYARWAGKTLPSEAQWHRAACGTPAGQENPFPWGAQPPQSRLGNFDFASWDPAPVSAHRAGQSAFGVVEPVGNGWEWTSTVFGPFPGFQPFPFYRGYSADFFDGKHFVMKGASPRTAACMVRRSFRNWFQPHYQYVYAGFRCVRNR